METSHLQVPAAPAPATRRGTRGLRVAIALAVTIVFGAVVFRRVELAELTRHVAQLGASRALLGVGVISFTVFLRALRLCRCLGEKPTLELGSASIVHNALVAILPAKLGEFALPALLVRLRGTDAVGGLGLLVALRLLDLLALGVVGGLAGAAAFHGLPSRVLLAAALASGVGLLLLPALAPKLNDWTHRESGEGRIRALLQKAIKPVSRLSIRSQLELSALSVAIWVSLFSSFFVFTAGGLNWTSVAVEGTAGSIAFALPLSGVANLGPFQAAWVATSSLLGHPENALIRALVAHGAVLVVTAALACMAGLYLLLARRTQKDSRN